MEQKTIGKFITALRKANGMTQKDLAEKLNVSDKTVSRWERDEGAPDLSVIPVLAEIFGVSCDELLRGERRPPEARTPEPETASTPKGEKQRQRLLTMSLSRYRTQSFISIGISLGGLLAAMICNLGFLRAYIGFFVGSVFYVASLVCQAIFINGAFLSVSGESLEETETGRFKTRVLDLGKRSISVTAALLAATLPLLLLPYDTYMGLEAGSWLLTGGLFAAGALVLCGAAWYFIRAWLLKKGVCALEEKEARAYWQNRSLKRKCALVLVLVFGLTAVFQGFLNSRWRSWTQGILFYDYDSFVEFMEQDVPYRVSGDGTVAEPMRAPGSDIVYYDPYGNEISEEEALREEVRVADGSGEGKVVCEFIARNRSVSGYYPASSPDGLPITVITQDATDAALRQLELLNYAFVGIYLLETAAAAAVYRKKRAF